MGAAGIKKNQSSHECTVTAAVSGQGRLYGGSDKWEYVKQERREKHSGQKEQHVQRPWGEQVRMPRR